jgi:hypothetical protein
MSEPILKIIDGFFFGFHTILILFNILGWIVRRWRFTNLITLSLTAISWFVLGIWFGWGYCICTDWHWQVRDMLGYQDISSSYIHFLIFKIAHVDIPVNLVNLSTVIVFLLAFIVSIYLNVKKLRSNKKPPKFLSGLF